MTPHPRDTDPLHVSERCDRCYWEGRRETAEEAHGSAAILVLCAGIILGIVLTLAVAALVNASARSATGGELRAAAAAVGGSSATPPVPEAPSRLVLHATTGQGGASPAPAAPVVLDDGGGIDSAAVGLSHGRTGIIAQAKGHGPDYLAIPIGPGHLVTICGPGDCWTTVSTDGGPNHEMLVAGRIADVAVGHWVEICAVPAIIGLCDGSWIEVDGQVTLPPTDGGG